MAVETRYVVMRNGEEVKTFMDKKQADEYDKMLDMADALTVLLEQSPIELDASQSEELSIFLAERREEVLVALQAKKAKSAKIKKALEDKSGKTSPLSVSLPEAS